MKKIIPVNEPLFKGNESKYLLDCIKSGWVSSDGAYVKKFEIQFKKKIGVKYCTTVSSGTAALDIAIASIGLKKNDEVIIPSFTIISCLNQVLRIGAKPIFIDSEKDNFNICLEDLKKKITKKTKLLIIPHIYCFAVDWDNLKKITKNIPIIEDASEVLGLKYKKKYCGSLGDISTFSFYSNKQITTGEGGMITTNNIKYYKKFLKLKNLYFKSNRFIHDDIGWNYRMSNLQAAVGLAQLEKLNETVKIRIQNGKIYNHYLKNCDQIIVPELEKKFSKNIFWVYPIILKNKKRGVAKLVKHLRKNGIITRPMFYPLHNQPVLKKFKIKNSMRLENSEFFRNNGVYLPSGLTLKQADIKFICSKIIDFFNAK